MMNPIRDKALLNVKDSGQIIFAKDCNRFRGKGARESCVEPAM
jgi:hypothetical protein